MIRPLGIDHFVLTVSSIERAIAFYERLGLTAKGYGAGRTALHFGGQKINLHAEGSAPDRRARAPTEGAADFCIEVAGPVAAVIADLAAAEIAIEAGPVPRNGARGDMTSIYFRDPDGNLVELSVYEGGA